MASPKLNAVDELPVTLTVVLDARKLGAALALSEWRSGMPLNVRRALRLIRAQVAQHGADIGPAWFAQYEKLRREVSVAAAAEFEWRFTEAMKEIRRLFA